MTCRAAAAIVGLWAVASVNAWAQGDLRRVTAGPGDSRAPAWSPDGHWLAYESNDAGQWGVYVVGLEGGAARALVSDGHENRYPAWSPDGTLIAFVSDRGGAIDLYTIRLASGTVTRVTRSAEEELFPAWAPDGRSIWYSARMAAGTPELRAVDLQTGIARRIEPASRDGTWPRWSPDGRELAFFSRRDTGGGDDEIYLRDGRSGRVRRLTHRPGHDFCPAWSPDGTRLVIVSLEPGSQERTLRVIDRAGALVQALPSRISRATEPAWAPDGRRIAFAGRDGARLAVFVQDVGGQSRETPSNGGATAVAPRVTFVANEGVLIEAAGSKVLVDALFGDGLPAYGAASPETRSMLERGLPPFDGVSLVLATHIHRDHFDPDAVLRHLTSNPQATFVSTTEAVTRLRQVDSAAALALGDRVVGLELEAGERRLAATVAGARVFALGLPHGSTVNPVANLGFLIEVGGYRLLHIGDTTVGPEEIARFRLADAGIDVALLPFWYLLDPALRPAVREGMRPEHIIVLHAPAVGQESPAVQARGGWRGLLREIRAEFPGAHAFERELARWP